MNKQLAGWAASSSSPEEVSNRVKGVVLALSGVIILIAARVFDIQLTPENIIELSAQLGTIAGVMWTLWGTGVALVRWFAAR